MQHPGVRDCKRQKTIDSAQVSTGTTDGNKEGRDGTSANAISTCPSQVFCRYVNNGTIQPGTSEPRMSERVAPAPFSLTLAGSAGCIRHHLRPRLARARRPGGPRAKEHQSARTDSGSAKMSHSRSAMTQVDASRIDTPVVSTPAVNIGPPACMSPSLGSACSNSNGQNAMEQGDAGRTDTPAISIFAGTRSSEIHRMFTCSLVGHGTDSGRPPQKPMCGTASAVAICGGRGRPESASACERPGTQAPTGSCDLSANPSSGQAVPVRGSGAKRPAAAPINIRGAFCRKSKIPRLT